MPLTPENETIALALHDAGKSARAIERETAIPATSVLRLLRRLRPKLQHAEPVVYAEPGKRSVIAEPVREYAPIQPSYRDPVLDLKTEDILAYGDTHFPFHDGRTLSVILSVVEEIQPKRIIHTGDIIDAYELSRFDRNPQRRISVQDEIDMARAHLLALRTAAPNAEITLLEGNHLDRLRKTLWTLPGTAAALNRLTDFQNALTWENLLRLDDLGISFMPYDNEVPEAVIPGLFVKHGSIVRTESAYTARAEMEKAGMSGISGHTHRLGAHYKTTASTRAVWVETGCTCLLQQEYVQHPNWQQGFVVMTENHADNVPTIELVKIADGSCGFRGRVYEA